jgi:DMSO/TMAO reductase YedYZ heme-binding membrane subunit
MLLSIIYFLASIWLKYRRLLGITTFLAIFTHAGIYIGWWIHIGFGLTNQLQTRNILAGYLGILCLFIGYITSNNLSLRLFKWRWKTIQYVSYIALVFTIFHLLFLDIAEYWGQIIILMLYITLKIIEHKKLNSI